VTFYSAWPAPNLRRKAQFNLVNFLLQSESEKRQSRKTGV
jgi:hypothetical protein